METESTTRTLMAVSGGHSSGFINYQPLLESLRPIKRTEEIVRLKNDGGTIAIIETTDDPGRNYKINILF